MKYFLVNANLPSDMRDAMAAYGKIVALPPWHVLEEPVCSHPDMLIAKIGNALLIHEDYRDGRMLLDGLGIPYLLSRAPVSGVYPEDVRLNALATEQIFLSNEKHISREALALADQKGLRRIHVRQGYAKCSCVCAGNAIATMDRGIAKATAGLDVLLLSPAVIGIECYDTGFIGGAAVLLDEHTLGFFGRIEDFEQYGLLEAFFGARGIRLISLGQTPLFDYGGAIDIEF